jgi:sugar phosphate isomerase/epimerase
MAAAAQPFFKRINKPIGIQLYTLGEAAQNDLSGTLTRLAATGYKEFELPSLYGRSAKDLRAEGDKAGVKFSSIHMSLPARVPPAR